MASDPYVAPQHDGAAPEAPPAPVAKHEPLAPITLETEHSFYEQYPWCLNVFPTVGRVTEHLRDELRRLDKVPDDWRLTEVMTNIFLLACAIADALDDYLLGKTYEFSKLQSAVPLLRPAVTVTHQLLKVRDRYRSLRLGHLARWGEQWADAIHDFLPSLIREGKPESSRLRASCNRLLTLLSRRLPENLRRQRARKPAAFRSQDLTGFDIVELGKKFVAAFPDREQPVLVVGLRTAGSYFAPLLRAHLTREGFGQTSAVTLRPKRGPSARELNRIQEFAAKEGLAVVVDEPANTGSTLARCVEILRQSGFRAEQIVAMFPVHPTRRDWYRSNIFLALSEVRMLTLGPEEYRKHRLLEPAAAAEQIREYFRNRGYVQVRVIASPIEACWNAELGNLSEGKFHNRLKRVYEVHLQLASGEKEIRYVLAKSVGWGWLSYHAFLAGKRLAGLVPPLLGLREGILYSEGIPQTTVEAAESDRTKLAGSLARYVAQRVRELHLREDPTADLCRDNWHKGMEHLAEVLSRAYGWNAAASLKRHRIRFELARRQCPVATLIDGKMRPLEWVQSNFGLLKTDYEHHGLGKIELSVTDPAYDLAEAILYFRLDEEEESDLLHAYSEATGDAEISQRLFLQKLLAGSWAMSSALSNLQDPRLTPRHQEFHRQYLEAWNFCTIHTMRHCAKLCVRPPVRQRPSRLLVLDIDGVLDKQIFGFPSTTAAGVRAISLLHTHGLPAVANTARSPSEVREYCRAYGFLGGVGEYGAYLWDAVRERELVKVREEALEELARLRSALRKLPGVFLNDHYRYSIKAYGYQGGRTVPLPTIMIEEMMVGLRLHHLVLHQTYPDSTIVPADVDKGTGLLGLLELVGLCGAEILAVGDSEPDLPMFRVATRSFAPSQISCKLEAKLLGCRIASSRYQMGLLEIVRSILHPNGRRCAHCHDAETAGDPRDVFWQSIHAADQTRLRSLLQAMGDTKSFRAFVK